ncbi:MAG: 3'-5' exonuclease [bacterium]
MNKKFKHLMLDLETLGNVSYSVILAIGAVEFDLDSGEYGNTFYKIINIDSCLKHDFVINGSTLKWWMQQNDEAKKELFTKEGVDIKIVLDEFSGFCHNKDYEVWGNSARFDAGILRDAYDKLSMPIPWDFRKERDVRTLVSFAPEIKENHEFKNIPHHSIFDCMNQIDYCSKIWNKLKNK